jgi:hypothetical protein
MSMDDERVNLFGYSSDDSDDISSYKKGRRG